MSSSTYLAPTLLAIVATAGLVLALVYDGPIELAACAMIAAPAAVFAVMLRKARNRTRQRGEAHVEAEA